MKKIKAPLQKMKYRFPYTDKVEHICLVDMSSRGGEFTMCGNAIPDSNINIEGFEATRKQFEGTIKDITCPNCLNTIELLNL